MTLSIVLEFSFKDSKEYVFLKVLTIEISGTMSICKAKFVFQKIRGNLIAEAWLAWPSFSYSAVYSSLWAYRLLFSLWSTRCQP